MAITELYNTCYEQIKQLRPKERVTRVRNMAWLLTGLFMSQCVHLSYIARKLPGKSQKLSKVKMLSRLLANRHIRVRSWYEPIASELLETAFNQGQVLRLVVDGSKVGNDHQLLMVALAYRRRTLPLAWTWVKGSRGHSSALKQCALLSHVKGLIPEGASVQLAGDSEFGSLDVIRRVEGWGWGYALRQKGNHLLYINGEWKRADSLVTKSSQSVWLVSVPLTQKYGHQTNFLAYWHKGEAEPWLLATNLKSARDTLKLYKIRMWIEEMFADFKGHGFDLEASKLGNFRRLSRLTLAVSLLYLWVVAFGSQTIKNGKRRLVDRSDRRDLSIFRIGLDMLERCFVNQFPFRFRPLPHFH